MTEKKNPKRRDQEKPKSASRKIVKRRKRCAGDGSLFLSLLCVVLCVVGVFFLKDFYAVRQSENGETNESLSEKTFDGAESPVTDSVGDVSVAKASENTKETARVVVEVPSKKMQKVQQLIDDGMHKPVLCFVIDDVGNNLEDLELFLKVPGKVTFAVLPGLPYSRAAAERITESGQELLLHQPMEAVSGVYPGPGLLTETMSDEERLWCLSENLKSVPGAVGVNNHMGSKGTSSLELSEWLLRTLKRKNLFFLDSRTIASSQMRQAAEIENWKILERNSMFLDNEKDVESLAAAIEAGKITAREKGHAVMIGHAVTSELADLMIKYYPALTEEGFVIENLTYLLNEAREKNEGIGN